ncbi:exo-alpha-sialidase [Akkermansiaceae bacterium]|nr:exo-alpha-sialidase [Akkermansiaceae bacterium]
MNFILAPILLFLLSGTILAENWKLQPLKYNNPDLIVDLGVGLWAWPLPMDYDGDGDLDLIVSCPDKPSNGLYFFENPTQDPTVKMPIFKPGVHIAKTGHNIQISYVEGEARILRENQEYVDFRTNQFSRLDKIYPTSKIHEGKGRTRANMWRYIDWEQDGDQDLIVGIGDWSDYEWDHAHDAQGRWQNGPLHGWVYLIKNEGGKYTKNPVKIEAGGAPIDVYGWPSPNFADFDGDGDLDLLCGEFLDRFTYFQNIGSATNPEYGAGLKLVGADGQALAMHLQMITPTALDWDKDGDFDLIVGDEDGRVALVENVSPKGASLPVFKQPVYFQQEANELKFGALATPFAHDWDKDGDEDILCGNTAGNIAIFTNLDGKGTKWSAPELLKADNKVFRIMAGANGSIQGPAEAKWGYTTLSVADWNDDGHDDILVNSIWPKLQLLRNTGSGLIQEPLSFWSKEAPPAFYWWQNLAENLQTQWRTTPLATDFDGDGKLDLVILDQEGFLTCQSRARKETRLFLDEDLQPVRLNAITAGGSGRVKLAVVDWDRDGRLDILTNSQNTTWWRNCEDAGDGKVILKKIGNLAKRNVSGHTSSPTVCDFDRNGKPDLIIGSENGRLYFIKHEDCVSYPPSTLKPRKPKEVTPPRFSGLISEEFIFQNAPHKECHASTLAQTSRGLVAAWFGGTKEKNPDVGIWSSYHDGKRWSSPRQWADGLQHKNLRYPCWNPVLYQPEANQPLMLFFKVGPNPREWWGELMLSYDRGRSFQPAQRLPEEIDGPVRSKPIRLKDGTLLCPSSTEHDDEWRFHFEKLNDGKWSRFEPQQQLFQVIQPTLLTHPGQRIQALYRSKHGAIITNESKNGGESWSPLKKLGLPNNNSGIEALTLANGRHLLLYNHLGGQGNNGWGKRHAIHLAVSDDGIVWKALAVIEKAKEGEFSYPAMIQTKDGLVHMTYTWNRKRVKHVIINPKNLKPGVVLNEEAWPE